MTSNLMIRAQQRWEYFELSRTTPAFLIHELNEQGQQGWELVTINHGKDRKGDLTWTAFLKRPCGKHDVPEAKSAFQEQLRIEPKKK